MIVEIEIDKTVRDLFDKIKIKEKKVDIYIKKKILNDEIRLLAKTIKFLKTLRTLKK